MCVCIIGINKLSVVYLYFCICYLIDIFMCYIYGYLKRDMIMRYIYFIGVMFFYSMLFYLIVMILKILFLFILYL